MATPGRYRHFRGSEYRVLFTAPWDDVPPIVEAPVYVVAYGVGDPAAGGVDVRTSAPGEYDNAALILRAVWVGAKEPLRHDPVVIYCNLDGVFARTEDEFVEVLPGDLKVARFVLLESS